MVLYLAVLTAVAYGLARLRLWLWLAIADYPLHRRPRSIPANLSWTVRRWFVRELIPRLFRFSRVA
ncbi:MAG: hypothetical protein J0H75_07320 [Rhizobiales bacterium]|nr:hypothetical protein [Hyphomicrobiales bacterium]